MKNAEKRRLLEDNYLGFFSLAMAMLRNEDDARDAVQEALVRVLSGHGMVKKDVLGYTFQTVRHCAIDILRHRRMFVPLTGDMADTSAIHEQRLRQVATLRDELPEALRSLVELHDEEGYTLAELSALTGLKVITVRRHLDEAHTILRKRIENEI